MEIEILLSFKENLITELYSNYHTTTDINEVINC